MVQRRMCVRKISWREWTLAFVGWLGMLGWAQAQAPATAGKGGKAPARVVGRDLKGKYWQISVRSVEQRPHLEWTVGDQKGIYLPTKPAHAFLVITFERQNLGQEDHILSSHQLAVRAGGEILYYPVGDVSQYAGPVIAQKYWRLIKVPAKDRAREFNFIYEIPESYPALELQFDEFQPKPLTVDLADVVRKIQE